MKQIMLGILAGFIAIGGPSLGFGADPVKIAFVDMQRALNLCDAGKEAKNLITQEVEKMHKAMASRQRELEKLREEMEKRGAVMSEAVRREKERDYQTKLRDAQRIQRDFEDEIRRKDQEHTEKILKELAGIIRKIAEEKKITLVVEKNQPAIIFIQGTLDLTEEVIQAINEAKKVSRKSP